MDYNTQREKLRLPEYGRCIQEMVDYESKETKRATPKGLDVMAAIGIPAAEQAQYAALI